MEERAYGRSGVCLGSSFFLWARLLLVGLEVVLLLIGTRGNDVISEEDGSLPVQSVEDGGRDYYLSHSCIRDEILHQRRRLGRKEVYHESNLLSSHHRRGRALLSISSPPLPEKDLGEPPTTSISGNPVCNPHGDPPIFGDCWYNCTLEDISGEDKKERHRKALEQTADWFKRALAVEPVKGNLRLSGYSACGQDGGVQLPHEYVEDGVAEADLVLLVTTRPTTGNTLAWAVACERDQWGRAIAGHVNVAPRHLIAEAEHCFQLI